MNARRRALRAVTAVALSTLPLAAAGGLPAATAQQQPAAEHVETKTITDHRSGEQYRATVAVHRTTGLIDRSGVRIELSGFRPSHNANSQANNGEKIEYPVVVMQCRGADPTPRTCLDRDRALWYAGRDAAAPPEIAQYARLMIDHTDYGPLPGSDVVEKQTAWARTMLLPFEHANGVSYLFSNNKKDDGSWLLDEPDLKIYDSPDTAVIGDKAIAARRVPIGVDGTADLVFDARARVSQPSLGCSDTQACSLVVVPILNLACADPADARCAAGPQGFPPGSDGSNGTVSDFLTGRAWAAASNWSNRFVVPISFKPDPAACGIRDERPKVPVFGSELADIAQQNWGAAYCSGAVSADYLPTYTQGSEYEARRHFSTRDGQAGYRQDAVLVTAPVTDSPRPVLHAPVALTGFAIAFTLDDANGDEVRQLTLTPRLLAKLITQSYEPGYALDDSYRRGKSPWAGQPIASQADANKYYIEHPTVAGNPESLFHDPEFREVNPDIAVDIPIGGGRKAPATHLQALRNPVIFQVESDIMMEFSRYVTRDPQARAWLDGTPDEHGMTVNPQWRGAGEFAMYSLLDRWVRPVSPKAPNWVPSMRPPEGRHWIVGSGDACDEIYRTPALTRYANVTNTAELAALSLIERRGSATVVCESEPVGPDEVLYTEKKSAPRDFGERALLAVTTLGHAKNLEMPVAALRNGDGTDVRPEPGSLVAAMSAARLDPTTGTISFDHREITGGGYPGVMLDYLAVTTAGLDRELAGDYADFLKYMVTDGQSALPAGYDPLPGPLRAQALEVAAAVRAQTGTVIPPDGGDSPLLPDVGGSVDGRQSPADSSTDGQAQAPPPAAAPPVSSPTTTTAAPRPMAATEGTSSWLSRWALPALVAAGLLMALAAAAVRVAGDPTHPLRRALTRLVRR